MTVLIAPDSFKGTLTAAEASRAMAAGVRRIMPDATIIECPIADGGDGTVEVLVRVTAGLFHDTMVSGPLGAPVRARWGMLGDGKTAVLEMAAASGLALLSGKERNPKVTTTFGTGQLISAALDAGAQKIIIGIGGSATNDGGAGMAEALGARFFDQKNTPLARGGGALKGLHRIDISGLDPRLQKVDVVAACDVTNVLCGPEGASVVYGPQKGATGADVRILDDALHHYGKLLEHTFGKEVLTMRRGGAAGGLGAGLAVFCGARLLHGIDVVLDTVGFDRHAKSADIILTGEGRMDEQLKYGKALSGVLERAARNGVPVLGIAGSIEGSPEAYCRNGLFRDLTSMVEEGTSGEYSMRNAENILTTRTMELIRKWI